MLFSHVIYRARRNCYPRTVITIIFVVKKTEYSHAHISMYFSFFALFIWFWLSICQQRFVRNEMERRAMTKSPAGWICIVFVFGRYDRFLKLYRWRCEYDQMFERLASRSYSNLPLSFFIKWLTWKTIPNICCRSNLLQLRLCQMYQLANERKSRLEKKNNCYLSTCKWILFLVIWINKNKSRCNQSMDVSFSSQNIWCNDRINYPLLPF